MSIMIYNIYICYVVLYKDDMKKERMIKIGLLADDEIGLEHCLMEILMEGMTKEQLCKEMDISRSTVDGFLNNKKETNRVVRMKMAQYCIDKGKE